MGNSQIWIRNKVHTIRITKYIKGCILSSYVTINIRKIVVITMYDLLN